MTLARRWPHDPGEIRSPRMRVAPSPWRKGGPMRVANSPKRGPMRLAFGTVLLMPPALMRSILALGANGGLWFDTYAL